MAPAHAPLASSSEELIQLPDVALTYATSAACASVTIAPESELRELLLPSGVHGRLQVVKGDAKTQDSGCELRVEFTSTDEKKHDVFDIAAAVDANMMTLSKNTYLRGVLGWKEITLEKMALQVDSKRFDVLLGASGDEKVALSSDMVVYGRKCSPQLLDEVMMQRHVIPSGVDAGTLKIRKSEDVAVAVGHELDCAVVLDVTARAPLLLPGHTEDAMNYLKAFDANLDDTFVVGDKKRMVATVQLYPHASMESTQLLTQDANAAAVVTGGGYASYNAPSKPLAFGIFAGFFGLVAMLAAVVMKKKSHEKHCEERYANASKAAQIRRVSIRMASPNSAAVAHRARDDFGHEDEEEKEYEEYGEDDGLL